MSDPIGSLPTAVRSSGSMTALLTLSGLGAAFGLASCCALPFLLAGLGLGTAWLAGIGLFALFHRTAFIAVALIGLGGAAAQLWRQRRTMKPAAWTIIGVVWLIGAVLFYYGYTNV
jgi:mercuric ion transport protein